MFNIIRVIIKWVINLLEKALELLKIFENNGYEAYLVGGFVRDYILKRASVDVDICTNATPKQIQEIFKDVRLPFEQYGSVHLIYKKVNFEITTYRMDLEYNNGRRPSKIMYTDKLSIDLKRRDFTMNTLCMSSKRKIINMFNGLDDIKRKVIKMVGDPNKKLKEDPLRILRAIRFATELNFKIDDELKRAIIKNKALVNNLSYYRKKEELNRIFSSSNASSGIKLLKKFGLSNYLGINVNRRIINTNDPIGIWVQVSPCIKYEFTSNEKDYMNSILRVLKDKSINDFELYNEGNYVCYIAAQILGINANNLYDRYDMLPIKKQSDIKINGKDIIELINPKDKSIVKVILKDIEKKIIERKLFNEKDIIEKYILDNYK